jgi:hypothetical protein
LAANLAIGPYLIEVSKTGFNKYVQSGLVLQVAANPNIDVILKVGSISEQLTVQAEPWLHVQTLQAVRRPARP